MAEKKEKSWFAEVLTPLKPFIFVILIAMLGMRCVKEWREMDNRDLVEKNKIEVEGAKHLVKINQVDGTHSVVTNLEGSICEVVTGPPRLVEIDWQIHPEREVLIDQIVQREFIYQVALVDDRVSYSLIYNRGNDIELPADDIINNGGIRSEVKLHEQTRSINAHIIGPTSPNVKSATLEVYIGKTCWVLGTTKNPIPFRLAP